MNTTELLEFLGRCQPLPGGKTPPESLVARLDEVCQFLAEEPLEPAIPLLLALLDEGDGYGVYPRVEDVLLAAGPAKVIPHLRVSLSSPRSGTRYWSAQFAASFTDPALLAPLQALLGDPSPDTRVAALQALEQGADPRSQPAIRQLLDSESDPEVLHAARQALEKLEEP